MKKSLIAMSVAAVFAAPMAANAAGTVYGQLQAEISQIDTGVAGSDATIEMADNARGRIGFKGSEELGNGMTMIGKMEFKVDTADGDSTSATCTVSGAAEAVAGTPATCSVKDGGVSLTKREMLVGLKQGWGTFTMGRLKSPYKYTGGVKYDPFVTTGLEARDDVMTGKVGQGNAQGHNSFQSDSVGLDLMGGKLKATIGVDEKAGNQGDITIGYTHKMGKNNEIVFAHTNHSNDSAQSKSKADYSATKVGGSFGPVKFQVEATDANGAADTFIFASYGMKMAGGKLVIQGGNADGDSYTDGVTSVVVGYIKKFTKSSRWFAGIKSNSGDDETQVLTYGMRFDY